MDIPNEPLYPFGFGLSYTEFTITPPIFEKQEREDKIDISCKVKNVGEVPGAEVVQCYVETLCAPVVRPDRELIRFRKIFLLPGEEQEVKFTVNRKELAFYGVGLEIHEPPFISSKNDALLKENMVITNEPGIYIPGKFGVRIEDTVQITKFGCISLTNSAKNYIII